MIQLSSLFTHTAWKVSVFGVWLVRIFPHSDRIRKNTPYVFVFSPNAKKYGPGKLRIRTLFMQCQLLWTNNWKTVPGWLKYSGKRNEGTFKAKVALSERPCNWFPVAKIVQKYLQKTVTFTKMTLLCGCLLSIILVQIN